MARIASIVSIICLFVSTLASVTDCSKGMALFKLSSMSFSPDPTVAGENSTLLLSMTVPEEIASGTATYSTTLNFISFAPTVESLCDLTVPCPIRVGTLDTISSYPIDGTLSGSLTIKIEWKDTDKLLLCVQIKTKLGRELKQY